jgi:hypothetical protein
MTRDEITRSVLAAKLKRGLSWVEMERGSGQALVGERRMRPDRPRPHPREEPLATM